jgi:hypothetical protein
MIKDLIYGQAQLADRLSGKALVVIFSALLLRSSRGWEKTMRRSLKYWVGFYVSLVGFLYIWETCSTDLLRGIFSDYRLYLGIILSALGFFLQNAGLKPKT